MENLYTFRNSIVNIYRKNSEIYNYLTKFIFGFIIYFAILHSGYQSDFIGLLSNGVICVIISLFFAITFAILPYQVTMFLMIPISFISLSANIVVAGFTAFCFFVIYVLYISVAKRESILILVTIFSIYFKMPYFAPIFAGLLYNKTAVISIVLGLVSYYLMQGATMTIDVMLSATQSVSIVDSIILISETFTKLFVDKTPFIILSAFITLICNLLAHSTLDYNREIAVISSIFISVIGIIFIALIFEREVNIILSIVSILISSLVAYIFSLFNGMFDYKKSKKVYFQDDENTYYVKIVPKMKED